MIKFIISFALLWFITAIVLGLLLVLTYTELTEEKLVVTIQFDNIPDQKDTYLAHLYDYEGDKIDDYTIYGDQWRIDVGFTKVDYYVNLLGIDSVYALNRFEGRYKNIKNQNIKKKVSYQLESHNVVDVFSWFVDTEYGSSTYHKRIIFRVVWLHVVT